MTAFPYCINCGEPAVVGGYCAACNQAFVYETSQERIDRRLARRSKPEAIAAYRAWCDRQTSAEAWRGRYESKEGPCQQCGGVGMHLPGCWIEKEAVRKQSAKENK